MTDVVTHLGAFIALVKDGYLSKNDYAELGWIFEQDSASIDEIGTIYWHNPGFTSRELLIQANELREKMRVLGIISTRDLFAKFIELIPGIFDYYYYQAESIFRETGCLSMSIGSLVVELDHEYFLVYVFLVKDKGIRAVMQYCEPNLAQKYRTLSKQEKTGWLVQL